MKLSKLLNYFPPLDSKCRDFKWLSPECSSMSYSQQCPLIPIVWTDKNDGLPSLPILKLIDFICDLNKINLRNKEQERRREIVRIKHFQMLTRWRLKGYRRESDNAMFTIKTMKGRRFSSFQGILVPKLTLGPFLTRVLEMGQINKAIFFMSIYL